VVAEHYRLAPADIVGVKKHQQISFARAVAMYLARELTGLSFPKIGAAFAKNHSTVIYAHRMIATRFGLVRVLAMTEITPADLFSMDFAALADAVHAAAQTGFQTISGGSHDRDSEAGYREAL